MESCCFPPLQSSVILSEPPGLSKISVSTGVKLKRTVSHVTSAWCHLPSPSLLFPTPVPFDLGCPLLEVRVGLSIRMSHLHQEDGQVIWPIGVPLKAVASGGANVTHAPFAQRWGAERFIWFCTLLCGSSWSGFVCGFSVTY